MFYLLLIKTKVVTLKDGEVYSIQHYVSVTCDRSVVSSTNKTDCHNITEISFKVALSTTILISNPLLIKIREMFNWFNTVLVQCQKVQNDYQIVLKKIETSIIPIIKGGSLSCPVSIRSTLIRYQETYQVPGDCYCILEAKCNMCIPCRKFYDCRINCKYKLSISRVCGDNPWQKKLKCIFEYTRD